MNPAMDASEPTSLDGAPHAGRFGVAARYFNAYRLAAYALILYALGHTFGAVIATPKFGPQSDAVASTMKAVHVMAQGADCTWYGFYEARRSTGL